MKSNLYIILLFSTALSAQPFPGDYTSLLNLQQSLARMMEISKLPHAAPEEEIPQAPPLTDTAAPQITHRSTVQATPGRPAPATPKAPVVVPFSPEQLATQKERLQSKRGNTASETASPHNVLDQQLALTKKAFMAAQERDTALQAGVNQALGQFKQAVRIQEKAFREYRQARQTEETNKKRCSSIQDQQFIITKKELEEKAVAATKKAKIAQLNIQNAEGELKRIISENENKMKKEKRASLTALELTFKHKKEQELIAARNAAQSEQLVLQDIERALESLSNQAEQCNNGAQTARTHVMASQERFEETTATLRETHQKLCTQLSQYAQQMKPLLKQVRTLWNACITCWNDWQNKPTAFTQQYPNLLTYTKGVWNVSSVAINPHAFIQQIISSLPSTITETVHLSPCNPNSVESFDPEGEAERLFTQAANQALKAQPPEQAGEDDWETW